MYDQHLATFFNTDTMRYKAGTFITQHMLLGCRSKKSFCLNGFSEDYQKCTLKEIRYNLICNCYS